MEAESLRNYYEHLVFDEVERVLSSRDQQEDEDLFYDIACIALNDLPPRYVRFSIDTQFYLTAEERERMDLRVDAAVKKAYDFVVQHPREK